MRLKIGQTDEVAKCVYDGELPFNSTVSVPVGVQAVYINGGTVSAVLGEGENKINAVGFLKAAFSRCKERQRVYAVNRSRRYRVLWGTGGIGFTKKDGSVSMAGANGSYEFAVDNASALLLRFGYPDSVSADNVKEMLKGTVTGAVKEAVLAAINKGGYNVGGRTAEIEKAAAVKLEERFADYGLFLDKFIIEEVTDVYGGENGEE